MEENQIYFNYIKIITFPWKNIKVSSQFIELEKIYLEIKLSNYRKHFQIDKSNNYI